MSFWTLAQDRINTIATNRPLRRLSRNWAAVVGGGVILLFVLLGLFSPLIAPYDYEKQNLRQNNAVPAWALPVFSEMARYARVTDQHLLGTDALGRDIFSRMLYGARVSLVIALVGSTISLVVGVVYGGIAGFFGGQLDHWMMRLVDLFYAFPSLLFLILLMAYFRSATDQPAPGSLVHLVGQLDQQLGGMLFIYIGIGLTSWEGTARLVRGLVLVVERQEYILAARAVGVPNRRILLRHILPNILGPLIVAQTLAIPAYISLEAFLSFLGLGVLPPTPSWGAMIANGAETIRTYPYQALFPALALAITIFAFNFLGDGLRDALDQRQR